MEEEYESRRQLINSETMGISESGTSSVKLLLIVIALRWSVEIIGDLKQADL